MTDLGEVLEVLSKLIPSDEESWISAWSDMGRRLRERAEKAENNGKHVTASLVYLRASTYFRVSLMCFANPADARMREYSLAYKDCYAKYLEYSDYPGEEVRIPYEDSFLRGYFYKSPVAKGQCSADCHHAGPGYLCRRHCLDFRCGTSPRNSLLDI